MTRYTAVDVHRNSRETVLATGLTLAQVLSFKPAGQTWAVTFRQERDFREIGRRAYLAGDPAAPALNADVQKAIAQLPVGGGAAGIMRAFSQGWDEANLAAELV